MWLHGRVVPDGIGHDTEEEINESDNEAEQEPDAGLTAVRSDGERNSEESKGKRSEGK